MRKLKVTSIAFALCFLSTSSFAQSISKYVYVNLETDYGNFVIKLYNETPIHKQNFIKLVKSGYFDKTTFNRIIKNFVIQGGDPDSAYLTSENRKKEQKWIASEFRDSLFHKKGVIAMGRNENGEKASFTTQFYIVRGKKWTDAELEEIENKMGKVIPLAHKAIYKTIGGIPYLDQNYTVFGEIVKGIELVDELANVKASKDGLPDKPVAMRFRILVKTEVKKL